MTDSSIDATALWNDFQRTRRFLPRLCRVLACVVLYFIFGIALMKLTGPPIRPVRGEFLLRFDSLLPWFTVFAFLFVTFWMIDSARVTAWFINRLGQAQTRYQPATLEHFAKKWSIEDKRLLDEWIDLQLIADLTEPVSRLIYWPFCAVFLLLISRNSWFDHWTWHWPMVVIYLMNLGLAAASFIILQRAAYLARQRATESLKNKVNQKQRDAAPSTPAHESKQAELLLDEIKRLRRGAFAPLSKNPLVNALLVNSSGAVLLQLLVDFLSK